MSNSNKPGVLFWIIGIVALLWNAMGSWQYIAQAYEMDYVYQDLSVEQIALLDAMPAWYIALFAIAVFTGLLASIFLLMRKGKAVILFVISFVAALVNQIYWLFGTDAPEVFSEHMPYLMPILIVVLGLIFIWFSKKQKAEGVLS
jgi:hypothetical protein